jgi:hypothetical protein
MKTKKILGVSVSLPENANDTQELGEKAGAKVVGAGVAAGSFVYGLGKGLFNAVADKLKKDLPPPTTPTT